MRYDALTINCVLSVHNKKASSHSLFSIINVDYFALRVPAGAVKLNVPAETPGFF
jgi:hypothetical protein